MFDFEDKNIIFRYRVSSDYALKELMKDSLVMSSADTFNDDHDFLIGFDLERATAELLKNDCFIKKMAETTKRTKSFEERYALLISKRGEHLVKTFINFLFTDFIKRVKTQLLLGCFSSDCCNPTMWAHYAGNGTGFVVGYDTASIEKEFKKDGSYSVKELIANVKYDDNVCDITKEIINLLDYSIEEKNFFTGNYLEKFFENIDDSVFDFFVTKNTQWSYEKEKRILVHMSNRGEAIHEEMIKIKPSVIIIGEKMNLPNRFLIASICKNKKIPLFIVENSYSCQTFRLGIRPVLPIEIDRIVNNFDDFLTFDGLVI